MEKINILTTLVQYLVFPGFLFLAVAGLFVSWADRKLAARMQWRVGPPLLQSWYDIRKLFKKELIIPEGGNTLAFICAPVIALLSIIYAGANLIMILFMQGQIFPGDLFVFLYLLSIPSVCMMLGASASANPYAALGASREMKLILSYELPLLISIIVAALKAHVMSLGLIIQFQMEHLPAIASLSGVLAVAVSMVCIQAKMGMAPFDVSEAETELAGGLFVEYSGPLLAVWKLVKMIAMIVFPLFLVLIFWAGGSLSLVVLKCAGIILIAIIARILSPRVRIDHALTFFWRKVTPWAILALLLAIIGI
ncbi:MAG: NADH-quinone oxidoreductase subunit H [Elusimicrobia bacterium]|nr:NADH-quinone oxidoreductase subunit H [Elusimicrobiota bacterium]